MGNLIIALPKAEDAKKLKSILGRSGYEITGICTTGAQASAMMDGIGGGILICGYKLQDMVYSELLPDLPPDFEMLLVASRTLLKESGGGGLVCLEIPFRAEDLISTVDMMSREQDRRRREKRFQRTRRTPEEERYIREAKELLMARNHLTEDAAHRYLQKRSMESGTNLAESARMILTLLKG